MGLSRPCYTVGMKTLILTGPPATGKNTIAAAFAKQQERCAIIDVDLVRAMLAQPHLAPWEGEEGRKQHHLGVAHACLLARSFLAHGHMVVIHDVLSNDTAAIYRRELHEATPAVVLLLPTLEAIQHRNSLRPHRLTDAEILMLYRWQEELTDYDHKIDNTTLEPEVIAGQLNHLCT